jgi:hypothetical protein
MFKQIDKNIQQLQHSSKLSFAVGSLTQPALWQREHTNMKKSIKTFSLKTQKLS